MTDETTGPTNEAADNGTDADTRTDADNGIGADDGTAADNGTAADGVEPLATLESTAGAEEHGHHGARARRRETRMAAVGEAATRMAQAARERRMQRAESAAGRPPDGPRLEYAEAEHIDVQGGSIGSAMARSISVERGALGRAQADEVIVTLGALGGARATHLVVEKGALGGAIAGDVRVRQGYVQGVIARDVTIEQGGARTVIANHVTLGRQSGALIAVARTIDGEGRVLLDWRGALALGAAFAVIAALLRGRLPRR